MEMDILAFRIPPELAAAVAKRAAAAGMSPGLWVRRLVEEETGVKVEVSIGLAGVDEKTLKRVQKAGVRANKKRAKGQVE